MFKGLLLLMGFISLTALAQPSQHILIDGSVARCSDLSDLGSRAFRITMREVHTDAIVFQIENLVCVQNSEKMIHIPYALSRAFLYHKDARTLSYEYPKANVVVLNDENTAIYQSIAINPNLTIQNFVVNTKNLKVSAFNLSLQPLEVIKIDGQFYDQGMVFGGSYRINLNK